MKPDLNAIEAQLEEIKEGLPWRATHTGGTVNTFGSDVPATWADSEFIPTAPAIISDLIKYVRKLEARVAELEAETDELAGNIAKIAGSQ